MILAGSVLAAVALWLAMAQRAAGLRLLGAAAAAVGLLTVVSALDGPGGELTDKVLFWLFSGGALGAAVLMIVGRDPVHGALWFAVTTLCVCGLFLGLSAPFLAAATIIVYAGAIIVTFMFVIMLAQQGGATAYDQHPRLPLAGSLVSLLVLGALALTLLDWQQRPGAAAAAGEPAGPALVAAESAPADGADARADRPAAPERVSPERARELRSLGRTLFGQYLFAVELGGTLLLIATIGAIALAPRRQRGNL
ncbi:MAG TPA: NADH-quinone oxidoreductase subunit J [Lacipirellulaceae bacterium]|nr:NADH-quinone oxidoreductase subunit J [Lacipirellulaceae bacterium]